MGDGASVLDDAVREVIAQPLSTLEEEQLDEEGKANDFCLERLDQLDRPQNGAASGEQVVHDEHALARLERVLVDLESVGAVLEGVLDAGRLGGQFAQLPD